MRTSFHFHSSTSISTSTVLLLLSLVIHRLVPNINSFSFSHSNNKVFLHHSYHNKIQRIQSSKTSTINESSSNNKKITIALTREEGKNEKLRQRLQSHDRIQEHIEHIEIHEIPCIEHTKGDDYDALPSHIMDSRDVYDYILITSPEAAHVFISACKKVIIEKRLIHNTSLRICDIACVGKATQKCILDSGLLDPQQQIFIPSKANAETLVKELPSLQKNKVLYPASKKAARTIEERLYNDRNVSVVRLNTYDTIPATWSTTYPNLANQIDIICVGSPSAIQSWLHNSNTDSLDNQPLMNFDTIVACIGKTSATACGLLGWEDDHILFPSKPGLEGWADSIADAIELRL